jgi:hypothetical protein
VELKELFMKQVYSKVGSSNSLDDIVDMCILDLLHIFKKYLNRTLFLPIVPETMTKTSRICRQRKSVAAVLG